MSSLPPSPYRSADERPVASCMLCGIAGLPGSTCATCAVPLPSTEEAARVHRDPRCPRCNVPMLAIAPDVTSVLHVCERCHGMFVPPRAWHVVLTSPEHVEELEAKLPPTVPARGALVASVRCPVCAREMDRMNFAGITDILVDTCADRHGIWLDPGEAGAVIRFTKIRDQVGDEAVRRDAEVAAIRERAAFLRRADGDDQGGAVLARLAPRQVESRRGPPPWPVALLLLFAAIFTLSGVFQARCGTAKKPAVPGTPQSEVDRNAAESERELSK